MAITQSDVIMKILKLDSISIDDALELFELKIPIVKRLAFIKCKDVNKKLLIDLLINDPCHWNRILAIDSIKDNKKLILKYLHDDSPDVKTATINIIQKQSDDYSFKFDEIFLSQISFLINDVNKNVRIAFSRLLRKFSTLSEDFIYRLFDKNDLGLFVYGCEDECKEVRLNIIDAIECYFIPEAFDFLVDMLNEDNEMVREKVSDILAISVKRRKYSYSEKQMKYILAALDENNRFIQKNILVVLSEIPHVDTMAYFNINSRVNISNELKYKCLFKIVENNSLIFVKYLEEFGKYYFDNRISLSKQFYVGELIILSIINPSNISMKISYDINYANFIRQIYYIDEIDYPKNYLTEISKLYEDGLINGEYQLTEIFSTFMVGMTVELNNFLIKESQDSGFEHFNAFYLLSCKSITESSILRLPLKKFTSLFYQNFNNSLFDIIKSSYMILAPLTVKPKTFNILLLSFNCLFPQSNYFRIMVKLVNNKNEIIYFEAKEFIEFSFKIGKDCNSIYYSLVAFYNEDNLNTHPVYLTLPQEIIIEK